MNNDYALFDTQNRAVIKESEASVEAALVHASDGTAVTLLMCWLVAIAFMLKNPALGLVCFRCNNGPLCKCDHAKHTENL